MDCLEQCMTIAISHVASSGKQYYSELSLPMGTTIYEALTLVPWVHGEEFEDFWHWYKIIWTTAQIISLGMWVFLAKKRLDTILLAGDRIEIYRPLTINPMAKRKALSKNSQQNH